MGLIQSVSAAATSAPAPVQGTAGADLAPVQAQAQTASSAQAGLPPGVNISKGSDGSSKYLLDLSAAGAPSGAGQVDITAAVEALYAQEAGKRKSLLQEDTPEAQAEKQMALMKIIKAIIEMVRRFIRAFLGLAARDASGHTQEEHQDAPERPTSAVVNSAEPLDATHSLATKSASKVVPLAAQVADAKASEGPKVTNAGPQGPSVASGSLHPAVMAVSDDWEDDGGKSLGALRPAQSLGKRARVQAAVNTVGALAAAGTVGVDGNQEAPRLVVGGELPLSLNDLARDLDLMRAQVAKRRDALQELHSLVGTFGAPVAVGLADEDFWKTLDAQIQDPQRAWSSLRPREFKRWNELRQQVLELTSTITDGVNRIDASSVVLESQSQGASDPGDSPASLDAIRKGAAELRGEIDAPTSQRAKELAVAGQHPVIGDAAEQEGRASDATPSAAPSTVHRDRPGERA